MRMKMVCDDRTLAEVANEFLALKKAQKVRERTLNDYKKYIDKFLEQSQNSLDVDVLKIEILEYFADIPKTSPGTPERLPNWFDSERRTPGGNRRNQSVQLHSRTQEFSPKIRLLPYQSSCLWA